MTETTVEVNAETLSVVLDFVEWDSALDSAPEDSEILEAIATLRTAIDEDPQHSRVQELTD